MVEWGTGQWGRFAYIGANLEEIPVIEIFQAWDNEPVGVESLITNPDNT